ncbi:8-oxo-dGTP diphosphatase MutT [Marinomonas sp. C2222]|uniref:8-oxo-dGTP diphosphatase n=1 Tax=Marinomonas sargassi TaxID=2984494 RepID=A0ABT2YT50_9GAMM|nr:8-oxo-dGTP diphosphatase MutT [Marinomonas sargassi]MCV2403074.1 8-oxo-dGTP diphosphatase MutT [Marinomonas sargassi]
MLIKVAAGIILRGDKVFISLRKASQDQGGLWEFPGGKCDDHETVLEALKRELHEECGITITDSHFFKLVSHDYGSKTVELHFYKVTAFEGEPQGKEGQQVAWVNIKDLDSYEFPDANKGIVKDLLS